MDLRLQDRIVKADDHRVRPPVSVGPRILIPGYPQWSWNQRDRALVLFGSFAMAILVGGLTWGTTVGLGILGFAYLTHVFSAVDAIRQNSFPGFGRFVPTVTTSAGLGAAFYLPALAMASVYAWPISPDAQRREGYFINRWAYRHEKPRAGETVWLDARRRPRSRVVRVMAGPGQRIEWSAGVCRVDDQVVEDPPFSIGESPSELKLMVPQGHVLVIFRGNSSSRDGRTADWEILPTSEIRGRAWAKSYPIWERGLLP